MTKTSNRMLSGELAGTLASSPVSVRLEGNLMQVIETDTNKTGQTTYLLEKANATGTLIVATVTGPAKISFRYLLTGKMLTARDTVTAWRTVNDYRETHGR